MAHFVGAGCGAIDLITVRGRRLLEEADIVLYAGSLGNPDLLSCTKKGCRLYNSAKMTLEEMGAAILEAEEKGLVSVRLHSGDPSLSGAVRELFDFLDRHGIAYDVCPCVGSFCGAAAALRAEYTPAGISQSVVITRAAGRTAVPVRESVRAFAAHGAAMVIFLCTGLLEKRTAELLAGGHSGDAPAAVVYKGSWPDEKVLHGTAGTLSQTAKANGVENTALVVIGGFLEKVFARSKLYSPDFAAGYREASE